MREYAYQHYDVVISNNLIKNGKHTRYKHGHEGRTRDKMSEQTKKSLICSWQKNWNYKYKTNT